MDQPKIDIFSIDIIDGSEYPDDAWRSVSLAIANAEQQVLSARETKREADATYEAALARRRNVQVPRDRMICTDRRTPAQLGRLADVGRARVAQIRFRMMRDGQTPC